MASEHVKRMGMRMKERREELGLNQRQVAERIPGPTDSNHISKWERGEHRPSEKNLEKLATALEVDIAYFHSPAPVAGTADLMETLASGLTEISQLDRIEEKLDQALERLKGLEDEAAERDELVADLLVALRAARDAEKARARRDRARTSQQP